MEDTSSVQQSDTFLDPEILHRYFSFLDPNPDAIFTYSLMDAESLQVVKGFGVKHGKVEDILENYWKNEGCTIHVCLNETNMKGRKNADMVNPRVWCVDIDDVWDRARVKSYVDSMGVQLCVESSPGKYHFYWKCDPIVSLSLWSTVQAGLAVGSGGDMNLSSVSKTIRVPGVRRVCKDGSTFLPRVVFDSGERGVCQWHVDKELIREGEKALESKRKVKQQVSRGVGDAIRSGDFEKIISGIKEGNRNEGVFNAVHTFVKQVKLSSKGGELEFEDALVFAERINQGLEKPLEELELDKTVQSAWAIGCENAEKIKNNRPNIIETIDNSLHVNGTAPSEKAPSEKAPFTYDYSDPVIKASRFSDASITARALQRYADMLVRVGDAPYAFDESERVWRRQKPDSEILTHYIQQVCLDILEDEKFIDALCLDKDGEFSAAKMMMAKNKFLSNHTASTTLQALRNSKDIKRIDHSKFDSNIYMLYVGNGVLDLRTLKLREARSTDYLLNRTPVNYDQTAKCPYFENFLEELFQGSEDTESTISMIRDMFAYTLTGSISEQKVFVHTGEGSNGKSKILGVLRKVCGGYSSLLGCQTLSKGKNAIQKEFDRIGPKIEGKRCVIIDDLDSATQWNEGFVKNLTGDTIPCRYLYAEEKDIPNRAKFHIGCNTLPSPENENYGILRRICIIPYMMKFKPDPEKEREIDFMINSELSGILNWASKRAAEMIAEKRGILYSEGVRETSENYKQEHFHVDAIFDRVFEPLVLRVDDENGESDENWVTSTECLDALNAELERNFLEKMSVVKFGMLMGSKGVKTKRTQLRKGINTRFYYLKIKNTLEIEQG